MSRTAFMLQLEKGLKPLPKEERNNALAYYREYWDDNAGRDEKEISRELGDPKFIAKQIVNDYAENNPGYPVKQKMGTGTKVFLIVLLILASPILIPLALAMLAVAISLVIALAAAVIGIFVAAIALVIGGAASVVMGIIVAHVHLPTMFFAIGQGLCAAGVGILLWIAILSFIRWLTGKGKKSKEQKSAGTAATSSTTVTYPIPSQTIIVAEERVEKNDVQEEEIVVDVDAIILPGDDEEENR